MDARVPRRLAPQSVARVSNVPLLKSEWVHSGAFVVVLEVALDDRKAVRDGVGNQRAVVRDRHRLQCASADFDDPWRLCIRQPLRGCGRGRRASSPRYGVETLSASELLPARMLPGSARATSAAAGWRGAPNRAAVGGQALGLHPAVRGTGADAVPADDLRGGGALGRRESAPGGGDLRALCGVGAGAR